MTIGWVDDIFGSKKLKTMALVSGDKKVLVCVCVLTF